MHHRGQFRKAIENHGTGGKTDPCKKYVSSAATIIMFHLYKLPNTFSYIFSLRRKMVGDSGKTWEHGTGVSRHYHSATGRTV